jgi:hypothetical protein
MCSRRADPSPARRCSRVGTVVAVPKRNRSREQRASGVPAPAERVLTEQERAARLFAESLKAHEAADRAERQRVNDAAARAALHDQLLSAKRAAVERLKQLRAADRRRPDEVAEAEATYRTALAELQEFETGVRPHWAPRTQEPTQPEPSTEHDAEDGGSET